MKRLLTIGFLLLATPVFAAGVAEINRALYLGISGEDVRALQEFLARDKTVYPEGLVTGYFGRLTEAAVKVWQTRNGIEPVGIVGPKTRAKLKEISPVPAAEPPLSPEPKPSEPVASAPPSPRPVPPSDTVAPVIDESSVQVSGITSTSATITWTTDEVSDSVARFTGDSTCRQSIDAQVCAVEALKGRGGNTTNHKVVLSGLITQTPYYFSISSSDAAGNKAVSVTRSFTTLSSDKSPLLPDLNIESITVTPAAPTVGQLTTITVRLTNPSRLATVADFVLAVTVGSAEGASDVNYKNLRHDCASDFLALGSCDVTFDVIYQTTGPKILWVTVDPSRIISEDNEENNTLASAPFEVIAVPVDDAQSPGVSLTISNPEATRVFVKFDSNEEALVTYEYGLTEGYGLTRTPWELYWNSNGAYIENLSAGKTYYLRAKAMDRAGNVGYSSGYSFTTAVSTPKPIITGGPEYKNGLVNWTTDIPCDGKVKYGLTDDYGNTAKDTNVADHKITLTGLAGGTAYHYRVSCASSGGTVESTDKVFTTGRAQASISGGWLASALESLSVALRKLWSLLFAR